MERVGGDPASFGVDSQVSEIPLHVAVSYA